MFIACSLYILLYRDYQKSFVMFSGLFPLPVITGGIIYISAGIISEGSLYISVGGIISEGIKRYQFPLLALQAVVIAPGFCAVSASSAVGECWRYRLRVSG